MKKSASAVSIIGGSDGPTSIWIAGKNGKGKRSLKQRWHQYWYQKRRKKAEAQIVANPHTIDELISYMTEKYSAKELGSEDRTFIEERKNLKAALVQLYKPELLGELARIERPTEWTEDDLREFHRKIEAQHQMACNISDEEFTMDFYIYRIEDENQWQVEVIIEKLYERVAITYLRHGGRNGKRKEAKGRDIVTDLYLYYGVSQEDIDKRTERFSILVTTLATKNML